MSSAPCDVQGKVSRQDVAELCVQLLSQHEALDSTFEVKCTVPFSQPFELDPQNPPISRDWQVQFLSCKNSFTIKCDLDVYKTLHG